MKSIHRQVMGEKWRIERRSLCKNTICCLMDKNVSRNTSASSEGSPLLLPLFLFFPLHTYTLATRRVVTVDSDGVLWRIHLRVQLAQGEHIATRMRGKSATEELSSLCDVRRGQAQARGAGAVTFVSPAKHMVAPPAIIPQYRRSSNFHIQVRNK